jgi:hypothetical protein
MSAYLIFLRIARLIAARRAFRVDGNAPSNLGSPQTTQTSFRSTIFFDIFFRLPWLDRGTGFSVWNVAMVKERITAKQLADMITAKIGVSSVEIVVRWDHAFGWQPAVVAAPGDLIGYQRRAEDIAHRLRCEFDLRD